MSNVINLNAQKIRPFSVLVHWSESREFKDNELIDFAEFEKRALKVALSHAGGGYLKTKITVTFDNGKEYSDRLDLGCNNTLNFAHYCFDLVLYAKAEQERDPAGFVKNYADLIEIVNMIADLDLDFEAVKENSALEAAAIEKANEEEKQKAQAEKEEKEAARAAAIESLKTDPAYNHLTQGAQSAVEVAKNMRKDVKKHFPGVKFSVRKSSHNCINISWTDGPTQEEADQVLQRYQEGNFNGYTDSYDFSRSPFNHVFGGVMYVFTNRDYSDQHTIAAIERVIKEHKQADHDHVTLEAFNSGELYNTTPIGGGSLNSHSWESLIRDCRADMGKNKPQTQETEPRPEYDPDNEYNPFNSIAGIKKFAEVYGVEVVSVEDDAADFEGDYLVRKVTLKKTDQVVVFQIWGDGKMAVFNEAGDRLSVFGPYSFFESYSNDAGTLEERIKAFSLWSDEQAEPEQLELDFECKPIQKTTHTQKGYDLFVVQLVERTTRDQFLQLCELAKEKGGYYSKFTKAGAINGFQFLTRAAAVAFTVALGNEEQPEPEEKARIRAARSGDAWAVTITYKGKAHEYTIKAADKLAAMRAAFAEFSPSDDDPEPTPPQGPAPGTRGALSLGEHDERQTARKERAQASAAKAAAKSDQFYKQSHDRASLIPFGQPILVGHHSEPRARRDAERIFNDMGKSVAESEKAQYYSDKAASVGSAGIASDDSEAVTKLKKKLEKLEKGHALMKATNKAIKQHKDQASQIAALVALDITEDAARELLKPDYAGRIGFASYSLSNNSAVIRSTKKRIKEIEALHNSAPIDKTGKDWQMNEDDGRICVFFDDKPGEEVRALCKSNGFKWSRHRGAWVRKITSNAARAAEYLAQQLEELQPA